MIGRAVRTGIVGLCLHRSVLCAPSAVPEQSIQPRWASASIFSSGVQRVPVITHEVGQLERHHRDLMPQQEELDVLGRCRSPSSRTSLSICWKIRYRSRSDMAAIVPDHRERPITLVSSVYRDFWNPTGAVLPCRR